MRKYNLKKEPGEPTVGVVIAGGGVKPAGGSYLFDLLDELDIPIDILAATSGGTPVAATRAIGYTGEEIRHYFDRYFVKNKILIPDYSFIMSLLGSIGPFNQFDSKKSFVKSEAIEEAYYKLFGDMQLDDLDIPLLVQATDLYTGNSVILDEGPVVPSILASGAIVPLLPPQKVGDQWLIEGAFSRETPFSELVKLDIDVIITIFFISADNGQYNNLGERYLKFMDNCFLQFSQIQRNIGVSVHHSETVMIPVVYHTSPNFWEGDKAKCEMTQCHDVIYNHKEAIEEAYHAACEQKAALHSRTA